MIKITAGEFKIDEVFYVERLEQIAAQQNLNGDVVIKLGDKEEARALNLQYLQKDYPTDVLSFPFNEELPSGYYLGDIFICYPIAEEQARESGITLQEELFTLMVHGLLHLSGLDHESDAGEMEQLQEQLVEKHIKRDSQISHEKF
ncbi:MAG: rRNA maturation RNase YbeY [Candidatus Aminicenantes bacterium]|nr:rRNA maturation RNase YbeY [Candidatus Aminicenantes bacterium]